MNHEEIKAHLTSTHRNFTNLLLGLSELDFTKSKPERWSAGQHLDHIYRSVKALSQALVLPKFGLKYMFGTSNRPSKTYEGLVEKYQKKLATGAKASGPFIPKAVDFGMRPILVKKMTKRLEKLTAQISTFQEQELDEYILPHPLLGKLTLREMMYFTIYHVEHHEKIVLRSINTPRV